MPKRTSRSNVFETNSSSVHAIIIDNEIGTIDEASYISDGGWFQWDHEYYSSVQNRLDYLWQAIWECVEVSWKCVPGTLVEWRDIIHQYLPNAELLDIPDDWNHSIDHSNELAPLLCEMYNSPEILGRFLTGTLSGVETWNDNDDNFIDDDSFNYPENDRWTAWIKWN